MELILILYQINFYIIYNFVRFICTKCNDRKIETIFNSNIIL